MWHNLSHMANKSLSGKLKKKPRPVDAVTLHATGPVPVGETGVLELKNLKALAGHCRADLDLPVTWQAMPVWAKGALGRYRTLVAELSVKRELPQHVLDAIAHYAIVYSRQLEFEHVSITDLSFCALALKYAAEARASATLLLKLVFEATGEKKTFAHLIVSTSQVQDAQAKAETSGQISG